MFGQQAGGGAPQQSDEVFGAHDDARHGGGETLLTEEEREEGQQRGPGARGQEVEGAGQSEGTLDVDLLVALHGGTMVVSRGVGFNF